MVEQKNARLDLGILIGLAYQSFTDQLRAALAQRGFDDLGNAYGYVFRALAAEAPSQRELARHLAITDQGMAKILDEMVERGYVERRPDPADARIKRLSLARRGREALAAARQFHAQLESRLVRDTSPTAVATLRRLLDKLAAPSADDLAQARLRPL